MEKRQSQASQKSLLRGARSGRENIDSHRSRLVADRAGLLLSKNSQSNLITINSQAIMVRFSNDPRLCLVNRMDIRDSVKNDGGVQREWEIHLDFRATLQIIAASVLPPPMAGNACILKGDIPNFLGVLDPENSVISFLIKGSPLVERRDRLTSIQRKLKPGSFSITPAGSGYEFSTRGQHISLNIAINNSSLSLFAEHEIGRPIVGIYLVECLDSRHPTELTHLLRALASLISGSRQNSVLYAQSLWTQIGLQLLWHHSSLAQQAEQTDTAVLSQQPMELVREYIEGTSKNQESH